MKNVSLSSHQELEDRVKELTAELVDNHEFIWKLRENPVYLEADGWIRFEEVINKIYKNYTQRLKDDFSFLTEVDIQLCILLKLQFNNTQIASITAVSISSVSVQKSRLKRRLLQTDPHLFDDNNRTLDSFLLEY
jgi:hypothetical protein